MDIHKFDNFLTKNELQEIKVMIDKKKFERVNSVLGRLVADIDLPLHTRVKFLNLANSVSKHKLTMGHIAYVEYSNQYGQPNLPPHFDASSSDLMIDFQIESNTSWDLGINTSVHLMEDNSLLMFNPNENIHWRPHKTFNDGEYVRMIFIRFANVANLSDYSHMDFAQNHPIFDEARKFRDSL
jgi:hypothetical protein